MIVLPCGPETLDREARRGALKSGQRCIPRKTAVSTMQTQKKTTEYTRDAPEAGGSDTVALCVLGEARRAGGGRLLRLSCQEAVSELSTVREAKGKGRTSESQQKETVEAPKFWKAKRQVPKVRVCAWFGSTSKFAAVSRGAAVSIRIPTMA